MMIRKNAKKRDKHPALLIRNTVADSGRFQRYRKVLRLGALFYGLFYRIFLLLVVAFPIRSFAQSTNSCIIDNPEMTTVVSCGCYFWLGQSYSATGYYTVTVPSSTGLDSNVHLNLTVLYPDTTYFTATACESYTWMGTTYTSSGVYRRVYPNLVTGCDSLLELNLTLSPVTNAPQVAVTQPNCIVGTATIAITPMGPSGFMYSMDGVNYQAGTVFSGVAPGVYSITARNASGCTSPITSVTVNGIPSAPSLPAVTITAPACSLMTGTVTVSRPRRSDYQYSLNGINFQSSRTFTGIPAGTYTLTVKDSNYCTSSATIQVNQPSALQASAGDGTIACYGGTTSVTVTASGGTAPYSGTGTFTVAAGNYTYSVTDANGCTSQVSTTVVQPPLLTVSSTAGAINCSGGTATVTITASGGTSPYVGEGTFTAAAGTAAYTVTDASGCSAVTMVNLNEPSTLSAIATATDILCYGGSAMLTVSATGGTAPYSGTGSFTVAAGTYDYTVIDANGCASTTSLTILEPTAVVANASAPPIRCVGASTSIAVSAKGGTMPYSGTGTFIVSQGTYHYTVTDANGCTAITAITLTDPPLLSATASASPIICNGGTSSVTVTASGGSAPYTGTGTYVVRTGTYTYAVTDINGCTATTTITLSQPNALTVATSTTQIACFGGTATVFVAASGGTMPYSGTGSFTASAGSYNYTVTDANGCWTVKSISITQPTQLNAFAASQGISCYGGTARVTVTATGGTPGYTGVGNYTVPAGTYSYTVTDSRGCTGTVSTSISDPNQLTVGATFSPIVCNGGTSSVTITASGGTSPYNGVGTFTASAGTFTYTVVDNNGCTASQRVTLTQPSAIVGSVIVTNATCTTNGQATVNVTGGTAPYSYLWSSGATTNVAGGLVPGGYTSVVTDAGGCTRTFICTVRQIGNVPLAAGSITGATSVRAGSVFNYYIIPVSGATSYNWSLPPLCTGTSTGTSINITFLPGFRSGTICVTPVNACGQGAPSCKLVLAPVITNPGGTKKPDKIPTGIVQAVGVNDDAAQPLTQESESQLPKDSTIIQTGLLSSTELIHSLDTKSDIRNLIAYPNPSRGKIVIGFKGEKGEKYVLRLVDLAGVTVANLDVIGQEDMCQILYDTSILAAGTYQLVVTRADGAVQKSIKLVVQ